MNEQQKTCVHLINIFPKAQHIEQSPREDTLFWNATFSPILSGLQLIYHSERKILDKREKDYNAIYFNTTLESNKTESTLYSPVDDMRYRNSLSQAKPIVRENGFRSF